jgi:hypothetical protein
VPRRVVTRLLDSTRVDDVDDVRDRDRCLGDVGGEDDSTDAIRRGLEDFSLLGLGDGRVEDVDGLLGEVVTEGSPSRIAKDAVEGLDRLQTVAEDELEEKGEDE